MSDDRAAETSPSRVRARSTVLWLLAGAAGVVGLWATVAPASFFDDFVFGRQWVALDGPYNEHLVRDVGGLNLTLAVVTLAAALRPEPRWVRVAAVATLVYAIPHFGYHAMATDPFGAADVVAMLSALAAQVLAPIGLLAEVRRS